MYEYNANAILEKNSFWSQEIERINTWTMSDRLTEFKYFASGPFY